jgi:hypothetical protein
VNLLRRILIFSGAAAIALPSAYIIGSYFNDQSEELRASLHKVVAETLRQKTWVVTREALEPRGTDPSGVWEITVDNETWLDRALWENNFGDNDLDDRDAFRQYAAGALGVPIDSRYRSVEASLRLGARSICAESECNVVVLRAVAKKTIYVLIWKI